MEARVIRGAVYLVLLAGVACSDGESPGDGAGGAGGTGEGGGSGGQSVSDWIDAYCVEAWGLYCEALFACCTDPAALAAAGDTIEGCKDRSFDCRDDLFTRLYYDMSRGAVVLNEQKLEACLARLSAMARGGSACVAPPTSVMELECLTAFEGTFAPGQSCEDTGFGAERFVCDGGVCKRSVCEPYTALGGPCDPGMDSCNRHDAEWCIDGVCATRGELGAPCFHPGLPTQDCTTMRCGADGTCTLPTSEDLCDVQFD